MVSRLVPVEFQHRCVSVHVCACVWVLFLLVGFDRSSTRKRARAECVPGMWSSGRRSDQRKFSVLGQRSKTPSKSTDDDASSRDLHRAWARVEIDHRSRKNALFDRRIDKPRERTSVVVAGKPTRSGRGVKRGGRQIRTEDVVSDRLHRAILRRRVRRDRYALEDDKDKDGDFSPSFVDTRTSSWSANDHRRAHVTRGRRIREEEDRFARLAQRDDYTGRVEPDEEGGQFVERIEDDAFDSFRFGGKGEDGGDEVEENESEDSHFEEEEGGDGENRSRRSSRVKTKAEIYEEIIHKSKQYRALRAQGGRRHGLFLFAVVEEDWYCPLPSFSLSFLVCTVKFFEIFVLFSFFPRTVYLMLMMTMIKKKKKK